MVKVVALVCYFNKHNLKVGCFVLRAVLSVSAVNRTGPPSILGVWANLFYVCLK